MQTTRKLTVRQIPGALPLAVATSAPGSDATPRGRRGNRWPRRDAGERRAKLAAGRGWRGATSVAERQCRHFKSGLGS